MPPTAALLLALALGSGCVAGPEAGDEEPETDPVVVVSDVAQPSTSALAEPGEPADICGLLPCDGPCSAACDYEALAQYVPNGTCVTFLCDLADGRTVAVHACDDGTD